jgi:hypothetical protein
VRLAAERYSLVDVGPVAIFMLVEFLQGTHDSSKAPCLSATDGGLGYACRIGQRGSG